MSACVSGCYACSAILWIKDDIFGTLFSIHSRGQAIFYYNSGLCYVEVYSYNVWFIFSNNFLKPVIYRLQRAGTTAHVASKL